jgi:predicted PurR-regulated permease PerM
MAYPLSFFIWLFVTVFILLLMKKAADKMIYFGDTLDEPFYKELAETLKSEKKLYFIILFIFCATIPALIFSLFAALSCI